MPGSFIRKSHTLSEYLTSDELQQAEKVWIRFIQRKNYVETFQAMASKKQNNLQRQLGLYIDDQGILRCTGRLGESDLSEGARYPILISSTDRFTYLMIEKVHKQSFHSGVSQTLSQTRHRFWIPHGRATVRKVIRKCVVCRYHEGGPYKMPPMASLPSSRVTEATPFSRTGLDYLWPLFRKTID